MRINQRTIFQHSCERRYIHKSKNSALKKKKKNLSTLNSCKIAPSFSYCGRKGQKFLPKSVILRLAVREGDHKTLSKMTKLELNSRGC